MKEWATSFTPPCVLRGEALLSDLILAQVRCSIVTTLQKHREDADMPRLEILNPVAAIAKRSATAAARPKSLDGKTIGLFWNNKVGGNVALRAAADALRKRHPTLQFKEYQGSVGSSTRYMTPQDQAQISADCDVVIGSTAD